MKRRSKIMEAIWGPFDRNDPLEWVVLGCGFICLLMGVLYAYI